MAQRRSYLVAVALVLMMVLLDPPWAAAQVPGPVGGSGAEVHRQEGSPWGVPPWCWWTIDFITGLICTAFYLVDLGLRLLDQLADSACDLAPPEACPGA